MTRFSSVKNSVALNCALVALWHVKVALTHFRGSLRCITFLIKATYVRTRIAFHMYRLSVETDCELGHSVMYFAQTYRAMGIFVRSIQYCHFSPIFPALRIRSLHIVCIFQCLGLCFYLQCVFYLQWQRESVAVCSCTRKIVQHVVSFA